MQNISFSLGSMLLSCYYDGTQCNSSDFTQFTTFDRGNCYMFNADTSNIKTSMQSGSFYGLQLELFAGFDGKNFYVFKSMLTTFLATFHYSFIVIPLPFHCKSITSLLHYKEMVMVSQKPKPLWKRVKGNGMIMKR